MANKVVNRGIVPRPYWDQEEPAWPFRPVLSSGVGPFYLHSVLKMVAGKLTPIATDGNDNTNGTEPIHSVLKSIYSATGFPAQTLPVDTDGQLYVHKIEADREYEAYTSSATGFSSVADIGKWYNLTDETATGANLDRISGSVVSGMKVDTSIAGVTTANVGTSTRLVQIVRMAPDWDASSNNPALAGAKVIIKFRAALIQG